MLEPAANNSKLRKFASCTALVAAAVLIVVKFTAWMGTGSIALLTSAVDAIVDAGASLVTYLGVCYADRPPDRDRRSVMERGRPSRRLPRQPSWRVQPRYWHFSQSKGCCFPRCSSRLI